MMNRKSPSQSFAASSYALLALTLASKSLMKASLPKRTS